MVETAGSPISFVKYHCTMSTAAVGYPIVPRASTTTLYGIEDVDDFNESLYASGERNFQAVDQDKTEDQFRDYGDSPRLQRVKAFYAQQHCYQTVQFVDAMGKRFGTFDHAKMTMWEALEYLDGVVDDSDPDTDLSQMMHAIQSAEAVRKEFPEEEWLQVVAFIHDCGKLLAVPDPELRMGLHQWAVVGDTFPVACPFESSNIFFEAFATNSDSTNELYNTGLGIYSEGVGFDNMKFSYGHDEYLYQVLKNHPQCRLPDHALYVIRFHSFYPWHKMGGYSQYANDKDRSYLKWLQTFNRFDLYSKSQPLDDVEGLKLYYKELIEKFVPGLVMW